MSTTPAPKPSHVAARLTMARIHRNEQRRQQATSNGYRGPLTRAEVAAQAARRTSRR